MNWNVWLSRGLLSAAAFSAAATIFIASGDGKVRADDAFLRGDVNTDGQISISDSLMMRRWLFNGDRPPPCHDSADFDDSGRVNIGDQISVIVYAFLGGPAPAAPYPAVGGDPTDDSLACGSYVLDQPEETDDVLRIGDVAGSPGDRVKIPVILSNSVLLEAFQVVLAYDPQVITIDDLGGSNAVDPEVFAGGFYEGKLESGPFFFATKPHPEDGIVTAGLVPHFTQEGFELPPGSDQVVFHILGTISGSASAGTEVHLDPVNTGYGPAAIRNEVTNRGDARFVSLVPRTVGGILHIVGDQTFFIRGDANDDAKVDISDAQWTLGFLFLGEAPPRCLDAADANDDDRIDISDPITTLQMLFLGGATLPAPYPSTGLDPTPGGLDC